MKGWSIHIPQFRTAPVAITVIFLAAWSSARAEELTLFTCKQERHTVSRYAIGLRTTGEEQIDELDQELFIDVYKIEKRVGSLDTGGRSFDQIHAAARKTPPDRFFASGTFYIAKSEAGTVYLIFFEYEPGHPLLSGTRFGIGKLSDLGSGGRIFVGDALSSRGFDVALLKQLKATTDRLRRTKPKR